MELFVSGLQTVIGHVSIDLRRADVAVPEHHLNRSQISAVFEQSRGEAVSQHVWRDVSEVGRLAVAFDYLPEFLAGEDVAAQFNEQ